MQAACLFSRSRFNTAMRRSRGGGRQTEEETNERERKGEEGGKRRRERERELKEAEGDVGSVTLVSSSDPNLTQGSNIVVDSPVV